jgi:putative glutamine amidotransferase
MLTGGHDVDPVLYRTAPSGQLGPLDRPRDEFEIALFHAARARQIPVLGICRGLQVINVAMGGTLWQDLPSENPGTIAHEKVGAARNARIHAVRFNHRSQLAGTMAVTELVTNSFHHQAIRSLAPGLSAVAWADDNVIEGVEGDGTDGWLLAVQWHPEEFFAEPASPDQRLFPAMVEAAREAMMGKPLAL